MRIVFCDDDESINKKLLNYVQSYFVSHKLKRPDYAVYTSGDEVIKHENNVDIAFLDVEMPGRSGIHAGAYLMKNNPDTKVFIVTSFPDYLDEAMKYHVFRYLSKPVDKERLFRNLKDALYQNSLTNIDISIETKDGCSIVKSRDIVAVEADNRKTKIYTKDKIYFSIDGIEAWKEKLNYPCFFFPYKSYIINMKYVASFDKLTITLKYNESTLSAYLARRKYNEFKDAYMLYLESMR